MMVNSSYSFFPQINHECDKKGHHEASFPYTHLDLHLQGFLFFLHNQTQINLYLIQPKNLGLEWVLIIIRGREAFNSVCQILKGGGEGGRRVIAHRLFIVLSLELGILIVSL